MRGEAEYRERRESPHVSRGECVAPGVRAPQLNREADAEQDPERGPEALLEQQVYDASIPRVRGVAAGREIGEMHEEHAEQGDSPQDIKDLKSVALDG